MPEIVKLGMYVMAPEPISTAYFLNPFHQSVSLYVHFTVQRFSKKKVTAEIITYATIVQLLDESFSKKSVSYQMKIGD
jgi:hypothetical protein